MKSEDQAVSLYPLREVPFGRAQEGIGFVTAPLNSSEVRAFKKELKGLLEDPIVLVEQVNQFLGPNIYTWDGMQSRLNLFFAFKERQMI